MTTANHEDSRGQSISKAVIARLAVEHKKFNQVLEEQRNMCATMLAEDVGIELDMVVTYDGELAIITDIYLDPKSTNGVSVRVECYSDDSKYAVIRSEQVTK